MGLWVVDFSSIGGRGQVTSVVYVRERGWPRLKSISLVVKKMVRNPMA